MIFPQASKQNTSQLSPDKDNGNRTTQKDNISDIDYFENFTLLDVVAPGDQASELQEEEGQQPPTKPLKEERKPVLVKHMSTDSPSVSEDSFVIVTDVEIVGEHLDEVFYGEGPPADLLQQRGEGLSEARVRTRRESQRSTKESGSVLFAYEETTLTPIFISPGPPKIIDPILLEEPRAMSFMYSDLYEDATGERRRSDEEHSEAGSVTSEKSCKRRFSDSEEADGYLEKFILKDETPAVDVQPESVDDSSEGRMVWPQGKFEMTGSLIRVPQEEEEQEKTKTEEVKKQEASTRGGLLSGMSDEKREVVSKTEKKEEMQPSIMAQERAATQTSGDSNQQLKSTEQMENQQMQHEVKTDQTELLEPKLEKLLKPHQMEMKAETSEEHQRDEENKQSGVDTEQACHTHKMSKELLVTSDMATPESREEILESETENTEKSLSKEASADSKMAATDQKAAWQAEAETSAQVTPDGKTFSSTELLAETKSCTETRLSETPEDVLEAVADRDCDCELKTRVRIELQDAADATAAVPEGEHLQKSSPEEDAAEILSETDQDSEVKMTSLRDVIQPAMLEEVETESDEKSQLQNEDEQKVIVSESSESMLETSSKLPTELTEVRVQDVVNVGDEFILLVPKGQAVEMDIEISQWTQATGKDTISPPEPDRTEEVQAPEHQAEEETKVLVEGLPSTYSDKEDLPLLPEEDKEQKIERALEEDKVVISPLRSFTPQEDLSGLHITQSERVDEEIKVDMYETEDVPEIDIPKEDVPCADEQSGDVGQHTEQDEVVLSAPDETVAQLGYEMISEQDAQDMPESKTQRDTEKFELQPEERTETETEKEPREELFGDDVIIEADYEIIDAEEESQARLAVELQGLDWFCSTCECLLSQDEYMLEGHHSHEVKLVEKAYEEVKVRR